MHISNIFYRAWINYIFSYICKVTFKGMKYSNYILREDILAITSEKTLTELCGGRTAMGNTPEIAGNDDIWKMNVNTAMELVKSYCRHWYDMEAEMRDIIEFDENRLYTAGDRVVAKIDGVNELFICIADTAAPADIENALQFAPDDDRNKVLVSITCTLVVYFSMRRNAPRLVSEQMLQDYKDVVSILKDIQRGTIDLEIRRREEVATDDAGQSFAWGTFEGLNSQDY